MSSAVSHVTSFWDRAVADFVATGRSVPVQVESWLRSYRGAGSGKVDVDALPEPYLGDLTGSPRGVVLALNPGRAFGFQRRDGAFIADIAAAGSYSAWAASWPYLNGGWERETGKRNLHHHRRLTFLRRWYEADDLPASAMVAFELYPWHSPSITASMRPDPATIREYVWQPIAELQAPVFAFGAPWFRLLDEAFGLRVVGRFGSGHRDYGSKVRSRAVTVFEAPGGICVVAEKHSGSAGPPSHKEIQLLREVLARELRGSNLSATR